MLLMMVAIYRGSLSGLHSPGTLGLLPIAVWSCVAAVSMSVGLRQGRDPVSSDLTAAAVLVAVALDPLLNLFLFIAGFRAGPGASAGSWATNESLQLLGFNQARTIFPLVTAPNHIAALGLATVVGGTVIAARARGTRTGTVALGMAAAAALVITLADTRSAIVGGAIVTVIVLGLRSRARGIAATATVALVATIPWVLSNLSGLISGNLAIQLSRGGSGDITNSRSLIWDQVTGFVSTSSPLHQLFGWGSYGQVTSGASAFYSSWFSSLLGSGADLVTVHNIGLQMVLDMGFVGLAAWTVLMCGLVWKVARQALDPMTEAMLAALLAVVVIGSSESGASIYSAPTLGAWVILTGVLAGRIQQRSL